MIRFLVIYIPSLVVTLVVINTSTRLGANLQLAFGLGVLAGWGTSEVLNRLTADLPTTRNCPRKDPP